MLSCCKNKPQPPKSILKQTQEEKDEAKRLQTKEEFKRIVSKKMHPFSLERVTSLIQTLKTAEYEEKHDLPKYIRIGYVHKEVNDFFSNSNNVFSQRISRRLSNDFRKNFSLMAQRGGTQKRTRHGGSSGQRTSIFSRISQSLMVNTLFNGEVTARRLILVCARLSQIMYWPDNESIKNTAIKLMLDKDIGLHDRYFKSKKPDPGMNPGPNCPHFYMYDEENMTKENLKTLKSEHRKKDLKYIIIVSKSGYMFVVYRGTTTIKNWIRNLTTHFQISNYLKEDPDDLHDGFESDPEREDDPIFVKKLTKLKTTGGQKLASMKGHQIMSKTSKSIQIHAGHYDIFRSGRSEIIDIIEKNKTIHGPDFLKTIIFTGHSLGGGLATLCYSWFKSHKDYSHIDMELITFGRSKVGDIKFKERMEYFNRNTQITNFGRFVFKQDLVQYMPTTLSKVFSTIKETILGQEETDKNYQDINEEKFHQRHAKNVGEKMGGARWMDGMFLDGNFFQNFNHNNQYLHEIPASLIVTKNILNYEEKAGVKTNKKTKLRHLDDSEKLRIRFGTKELDNPMIKTAGVSDHNMMNYLHVLIEELEPRIIGNREDVLFKKINMKMMESMVNQMIKDQYKVE